VTIDAGAGVGDLPDSKLLLAESPKSSKALDPIREGLRQKLQAAEQPPSFADLNRRRAISMDSLRGTDEFTYVKHYRSHVETFVHWLVIISRGISGKAKVLHYDLKTLVNNGGLATAHLDGTLLTMDNSCLLFVLFLMLSYAFVFVMMWTTLGDGVVIETQPLENFATSMNKMVPFVMGLYVAVSVNRWWTIRWKGLDALFSAIVDVQMVVSCVMHQEKHKAVRTLVIKWSFASVFLLTKAVRNQSNMNDMLYKGLLSADEIAVLAEVEDLHGRPAILWGWVLRLVHASFHDAHGPMPYSIHVTKIADICMAASSGLSVIDMHLRTALPFVYVHMITLLVDINNMAFVVKAAVTGAVAQKEGDYSRLGSEILTCLMVPTLYRGLLSVSYAIFDPFGEDPLDFPLGSLIDYTAACSDAILRAQVTFPGVPDSVYAASRSRLLHRGKLSVENPDRFAEIKARCRRIILHAHRSGKLEVVLRKVQAKTRSGDENGPKPEVEMSNAKMVSSLTAATIAAEPLADELRQFGKTISAKLIRLRHEVYTLNKAFVEDGVCQHQDFQKAVVACGRLVQSTAQSLSEFAHTPLSPQSMAK
jgi:hypothetical protein